MGSEMVQANTWSGGSFVLKNATLLSIDTGALELQVIVSRRGKGETTETIKIDLDAQPNAELKRQYDFNVPNIPDSADSDRLPIDDVTRRLARLCWIVKRPDVSGKLVQLALQQNGTQLNRLPPNMYLNQVPHNRYVRQYFYDQVSQAVREAVILCARKEGPVSNRMKVVSLFPETNPGMDSYRIGTILEMVRDMAITLAEENLRVRVCVQGSMGTGIFTGVPKQLSGVAKLLTMMDWQSNEGEVNEGMVGTYVNFGEVGAKHVVDEVRDSEGNIIQHQDDVFIIIAPQSMVGSDSSIIGPLQEMVKAAGDRPVILLNPDLVDKISAAGQQNVRGRQERIDFADSFETVFCFQNLYPTGAAYFPIVGALTKIRPTQPWIAHQRFDRLQEGGGEIYIPMLCSEAKPSSESISSVFQK